MLALQFHFCPQPNFLYETKMDIIFFFFYGCKKVQDTIYDNLESVEEAYLKIPDVGEEEAEEGESQRPLRHCADDMSSVTLKKRSHRRARLKKVPYTCFLKAGVA